MPFTAEMRQKTEQIRNYLFGGGYPNPMTNAEQLSYLFFFNMMERLDSDNLLRSENYKSIFSGKWKTKNPLNAEKSGIIDKAKLKWSAWAVGMTGEALVRFVRDEVFPFYADVTSKSANDFLRDARLVIDEPIVLKQVLTLTDELRLDTADSDAKGDLFEHVLKQIKQAGELGQFRTPRHIIRTIVEMVNPQIGETIYDAAAGTAGFLVAAYNHIRLQHSSDASTEEVEIDSKLIKRGLGDKLSKKENAVLRTQTFYGNDVDSTMVHLATMNLMLRGLADVRILKRNALTQTMDRDRRAEYGLPLKGYDVILANPPFSGKIDKDRIVDDVKVGTATNTEILFLKYMMNSLKQDGRCSVIVPEGVLFNTRTKGHKELRRQLIENNTLQAVMSLPSGVFKPYSDVKTSVLFFSKGGETKQVMFLHVDDDGYQLDAQHDTAIDADDLPLVRDAYQDRTKCLKQWSKRDTEKEWEKKWWFAERAEIVDNDYNLSASSYRPIHHADIEHENPVELIDELIGIETKIHKELEMLRKELL